jgi:hypothetical protein
MLDTNGIVLINTHGYLTGKKGLGTQCMLGYIKSKQALILKICTFSEDEDYRNLLIVASRKPIECYIK